MTLGLPKALALLTCAGFLAFAFWQVRMLDFEEERPPQKPSSQAGEGLRGTPMASEPMESFPKPALAPESVPAVKWQSLETEDYQQYLANLRAIGCPEQTVRDIVAADLLSAYSAQRKEALLERYRNFKYWRSDTQDQAARTELERKRRLIDQDMNWAMRELLGQDFIPPSAAQNWRMAELDAALGFLSEDKRARVRNLLIERAGSDQQMQALASGQDSPNAKEALEDYERVQKELQQTLSAAELSQVEMTSSPTAEQLRRRLAGFNPTEAEFQMLFREWQEYEQNLARMSVTGEAEPEALRALLEETLKARLGEDRAREFFNNWKRF